MPRGKKGTRVVKAKSKFFNMDVHPGGNYVKREGYTKNGRHVPARWVKPAHDSKQYGEYKDSVTMAKRAKAARKTAKPAKVGAPKKKLSAMYNHKKKPGYNYTWRPGYTTQNKKGKAQQIKGRWIKHDTKRSARAYAKSRRPGASGAYLDYLSKK